MISFKSSPSRLRTCYNQILVHFNKFLIARIFFHPILNNIKRHLVITVDSVDVCTSLNKNSKNLVIFDLTASFHQRCRSIDIVLLVYLVLPFAPYKDLQDFPASHKLVINLICFFFLLIAPTRVQKVMDLSLESFMT